MDLISREKAVRVTIGMRSETGIDEAPYEYAESNLKNLPSAFDGMTNGEVIQALFPNTPIDTRTYAIWVGHDDMSFTRAWWNAPYKAESEDKE